MDKNKEITMEDTLRAAQITLIQLCEVTRKMIDENPNAHASEIRRNCETICEGMRDLGEAIRYCESRARSH